MDNLLGKKLRDKITGFEGIATSLHIYLTGCNQYGLQPPIDRDGKIPDIRYFDDGRLSIVFIDGEEQGLKPEDVKGTDNGCDYREHP